MSSNLIHILTIAGKAAVECEASCERLLARRSQGTSNRRDHDWPQADRKAIDRLCTRLLNAAFELPVVYYAQYLDSWTVATSQYSLLKWPDGKDRRLQGAEQAMAIYPSRFGENLRAQIKRRRRTELYRRQTQDRYFLDHIDEAIQAATWLMTRFLVVAIPQFLGGSRSPDAIRASLDKPLKPQKKRPPSGHSPISFSIPLPKS